MMMMDDTNYYIHDFTKEGMTDTHSHIEIRKHFALKKKCEVAHGFVKKEEKNDPLYINKKAEASLPMCSNKTLTVKEDLDGTLVNIKQEKLQDEKYECSDLSQYAEETVYKKLTRNLTEYEADPLDISIDDVKVIKQDDHVTQGLKKHLTENIIYEKKYLSNDDTQCTLDVFDHKIECSNVSPNPFYRSVCEDDIHQSTSNNRRTISSLGTKQLKLLSLNNKKFPLKNHSGQCITGVHRHIKIYECNDFNRRFSQAGDLRRHINTVHKGIKNYKCDLCHKLFSELKHLRTHISSVHMGIKNYECHECHNMFARRGGLKLHINTVHRGIKNYQCSECYKMFSEARHFRQHNNSVHKHIKNYECDKCYRKFSEAVNLRTHISAVHKGIKNFKCDVCHKTFLQGKRLRAHINAVHMGIKNYECHECHKMFSVLGSLKRHIFGVHKGVENFECNFCHKMFSLTGNLKRHNIRVHKEFKSRI